MSLRHFDSAASRRGRQRGFTILEIIISFGLFLIAAVATLGAQVSIAWSNRTAAERAAATMLLNDKTGWLKAQPFDESSAVLAVGSYPTSSYIEYSGLNTFGQPNPDHGNANPSYPYCVTWTISQMVSGTSGGRTAAITVRWWAGATYPCTDALSTSSELYKRSQTYSASVNDCIDVTKLGYCQGTVVTASVELTASGTGS